MRVLLAQEQGSGRHERALRADHGRSRARRQGWALAALAHPGPTLAPLVTPDMRRKWLAAIEVETDSKVLLSVAQALQSGRLTDQQFSLALRYAAKAPDPLEAAQFHIQLLKELGLALPAHQALAAFIRSPQFKAADAARRTAIIAEFDEPYWTLFGGAQRDDLETLVAAGSRSAMIALAYYYGDDAHPNPARVILGLAYAAGMGVRRDPAEALRWFKLATHFDPEKTTDSPSDSSTGAEAMVAAATLGWGMVPDVAVARTWLAKAAMFDGTDARAWVKACGLRATLACLRRQPTTNTYLLKPAAGASITPPDVGGSDVTTDPNERERILQTRLDGLQTAGADNAVVVETVHALSDHYLLNGRPDDALNLWVRDLVGREVRADQVFGNRDNFFALTASSCGWYQASKLAKAMNRPEAALFFAKQAVNRLQQARKRLADLPDALKECFVEAHRDRYRLLADLFMQLGRYGEAENVLDMLKDFENYSYTRGEAPKGRMQDVMPLAPAEREVDAAFEKAVAALSHSTTAFERLQALEAGGATLSPEQQREKEAAQTAIAAAQTAFLGEKAALRKSVAALDRTRQAGQGSDTLQRVEAVKSNLIDKVGRFGPDAVALHAVVLPDRVTWLMTTGRWQKAITVQVPADELRTAVGRYREAIKRVSPDAQAKAQAVYTLAFAPVDAALRAVGAKHVMLSLDDCLRYLPFAALYDGKDWLVRRYAFSGFGAVDDLDGDRAAPANWRIAGLGTTAEGTKFSPLPGVAAELDAVVKGDGRHGLLPGIARLNAQFDDKALRGAITGQYQVVHVASHFALDPRESGASFLLLGDGSELPLAKFSEDGGYTFTGVDLLALSACDTAMAGAEASGQELQSLAAQTRNMGARAVLASLWSVSDGSTATLMSEFYRAASTGAASKSDALRDAQLVLLQSAGKGQSRETRTATLDGAAPPRPSTATLAHPLLLGAVHPARQLALSPTFTADIPNNMGRRVAATALTLRELDRQSSPDVPPRWARPPARTAPRPAGRQSSRRRPACDCP